MGLDGFPSSQAGQETALAQQAYTVRGGGKRLRYASPDSLNFRYLGLLQSATARAPPQDDFI